MACTGACNQGRACTCVVVDNVCTYCGQTGHRASQCKVRADNGITFFEGMRNVLIGWILGVVFLWAVWP